MNKQRSAPNPNEMLEEKSYKLQNLLMIILEYVTSQLGLIPLLNACISGLRNAIEHSTPIPFS